MSFFFAVLALFSEFSLVFSLLLGHFPGLISANGPIHIFVGLGSALLAMLTHCLVFAIFTGSGKDAREVTEDLFLKGDYVRDTKMFRRENYPMAMYAILVLLLTVLLGGALGSTQSSLLRGLHLISAWFCVLYNGRVFWKESYWVRQNAKLIRDLNQEASAKAPEIVADKDIPLLNLSKEPLEWNTHVRALGKFLCFLAWNVWLPYLYLKFIVGYFYLPLAPFMIGFVILLLGGIYLRVSYRPTLTP